MKLMQIICTNIHRKHCSNLKNLLKVTAGFNIWGVWWHAHASAHAWNIGDMQKKAHLVWLKKLPGVQHIARLKQQSSLSFPFYQTQRSYEKIMCICLLFYWFSGENSIRSSHPRRSIKEGVLKNFVKFTGKYVSECLFNKFAGVTDFFTYRHNL